MLPRVLVLCTVETGLDAVAEVLRNGFGIAAIVGVQPSNADPLKISGYTNVAVFAQKWNIKSVYVNRYDLKHADDKVILSSISFDLVWVVGWQRLIPDWLIELAPLGAVGGHGSPDGIRGGRGRSPQNWAIMLGCQRFDLALFKIMTGIDDGPIVTQRSFFYNQFDDISVSYKKAALCSAQMMIEVLQKPILLKNAIPQAGESFYYPQRIPEDGYVDWNLAGSEIHAHCRSLTQPYPGLRSFFDDNNEIIIWKCQPFDDLVEKDQGSINFVFEDGSFLVQAADSRLLVTDYELVGVKLTITTHDLLKSKAFADTIKHVVDRHRNKYPDLPIAKRFKSYDK
jgi:methionyl-tRNA formyltransferase